MRGILTILPLLLFLWRLLLAFLRFLLLLVIALRLATGNSLGKLNQLFEALGEEAHVERVLGAIKGRDGVQIILQYGYVLVEGYAGGQRLKIIDWLVEERIVYEDELIGYEGHLEPRFEVRDCLLNDLFLRKLELMGLV
jgi:hypothetical protein